MNSLRITFNAETPLTLPMSYNYQVQGALYAQWRDVFPELHDVGYGDAQHSFRMFTFSPLRGKYTAADKRISFTGSVSFEVRSAVPKLIESLCDGFQQSGVIRLGQTTMPLVNLECCDRLLFRDTAVISTLSPIVIYTTLSDGHTLYHSPTEPDFETMVRDNLAAKLRAAGLTHLDTRIMLRPYPETLRKVVSNFKHTIINGWNGKFRLYAHPETMAFLYYTGIGSKSSQGYGMFQIETQ